MKTQKFDDGVFDGERVVATTYEERLAGITAMGEAQINAHLTWLEDARAGVPIMTIKALMGHASITTTQRYLHSTADDARAAIALLEGGK